MSNMTQEEEQLLFDDLSGRLRYGVICQIDYHDDAVLWGIPNTDTFTFCDGVIERYISQVKPYLRPKSYMTTEEIIKYRSLCSKVSNHHPGCASNVDYIYYDTQQSLDYLNSILVDFRGLIEKDLALKAPEYMY